MHGQYENTMSPCVLQNGDETDFDKRWSIWGGATVGDLGGAESLINPQFSAAVVKWTLQGILELVGILSSNCA